MQGGAERQRELLRAQIVCPENPGSTTAPPRRRPCGNTASSTSIGGPRRPSSTSIVMPSMTERKSSLRRLKAATGPHKARAVSPARRLAAIDAGDLSAPDVQPVPLFLNRGGTVGDIVRLAAERIDRIHRIAPSGRHQPHRPVERRARSDGNRPCMGDRREIRRLVLRYGDRARMISAQRRSPMPAPMPAMAKSLLPPP